MPDVDYYECGECAYATNSPSKAALHENRTGHSIVLWEDDEDDE